MDCFGTCFTHAQTSDVKPPCKRPRSPLQRWRQPLSRPLQAPLKPPSSLWSPLWALKGSEGEAPSTFRPSSLPPSPPDPSSPLEGSFWREYLETSPFAWKLRQLLIDGFSAIDPAVGQFWHEHYGISSMSIYRDTTRCLCHIVDGSAGTKMRACQAAILPEHADERFIWRCTGEVAIMKIKVGLALPDMPSTTHEVAHNETFHVQGTHDETEWPRSGNSNSRSRVCFLQLHHLFILR